MSVPKQIESLVGDWTGTNSLWLFPGDPVRVSDTTARIQTVAKGKFLAVTYTWAEDGEPEEGFMLLGDEGSKGIRATWVDSWHMSDAAMACQGVPSEAGVAVQGSYPAPEGPDWGWRIVLESDGPDGFQMRMVNITPDGDEALAVEAKYSRV